MSEAQLELSKLQTIRQIAKTGIIPENFLRQQVKNGKIRAFIAGKSSNATVYLTLKNVLDFINQDEKTDR